MINPDPLNDFEAELRKVKPARPPEEFLRRLQQVAPPAMRPAPEAAATSSWWRELLAGWHGWQRWALPITAVAVGAVLVWRVILPGPTTTSNGNTPGPEAVAPAALRADSLEIDRRLVSSFDAIAELPSGEPVRLQCEEWVDEFVLRNENGGFVVEKRVPRFEVVGVSYETY